MSNSEYPKKFGVRTRKGLGDQLFGLTIVNRLIELLPDREIIAAVRPWPLHEYISRHAPFKVVDSTNLKIQDGYPTWKTQLDMPSTEGHILEGFYRNIAKLVGAPLDKAPTELCYFGPPVERNPKRIGLVYVEESRVAKPVVLYRHWRFGMQKLQKSLSKKIGYPVELSPWFETPEALTTWLGECKLLVTPESGLYNLAAALRIPCVAILGGKWTASNVRYPGCEYVESRSCRHAPCRRWKINQMPCCQMAHKPPYEIACVSSISVETVEKVVMKRISEIDSSCAAG